MPQTERALRLLGLAARARALVIGTPLVCTALSRSKAPLLVLCAKDASENTRKRLADRTAFYHTELITLPLTCAELAHTIGKKEALIAAVCVTDQNLAAAIAAALKEHN